MISGGGNWGGDGSEGDGGSVGGDGGVGPMGCRTRGVSRNYFGGVVFKYYGPIFSVK